MSEVDKVFLPGWCQEAAVYNQGLAAEQQKQGTKVSAEVGGEKTEFCEKTRKEEEEMWT